MTNKLFLLILTLIFVLTGCSLAQPERTLSQGRLVGVFITTEPLDLTDPDDFSVSVSPSGHLTVNDPEPRVLEAQLADRSDTLEDGHVVHSQEYRFPDQYPGYLFCAPTIPAQGDCESYVACIADPVIDNSRTHIHETDDGTNLELDGKIYAAVNSGNVTVYYNPVYQREDGSVYTLTGSGISTNTDAVGQQFSQKQEDTQTCTANGKTVSLHNSVNVSLEVIETPALLRVLQMDEEHRILHTAEFSPADMPDTLSLLPRTHYVICEYITLTQEVSDRKIYGHSDETIQSFVPQKDGLCLPKNMNLQWNE